MSEAFMMLFIFIHIMVTQSLKMLQIYKYFLKNINEHPKIESGSQ